MSHSLYSRIATETMNRELFTPRKKISFTYKPIGVGLFHDWIKITNLRCSDAPEIYVHVRVFISSGNLRLSLPWKAHPSTSRASDDSAVSLNSTSHTLRLKHVVVSCRAALILQPKSSSIIASPLRSVESANAALSNFSFSVTPLMPNLQELAAQVKSVTQLNAASTQVNSMDASTTALKPNRGLGFLRNLFDSAESSAISQSNSPSIEFECFSRVLSFAISNATSKPLCIACFSDIPLNIRFSSESFPYVSKSRPRVSSVSSPSRKIASPELKLFVDSGSESDDEIVFDDSQDLEQSSKAVFDLHDLPANLGPDFVKWKFDQFQNRAPFLQLSSKESMTLQVSIAACWKAKLFLFQVCYFYVLQQIKLL